VAQGERETIGERTRAALRHKIAKGERCGKVRFGYDVTLAGVLVPNPREQQAVALMRDLRGMGLSYPAIARELQDRGVRTKEGGPWLNTSVRSVLARAGRLPA
jgi:DNA invertase Pin-like site-specific DNA recombinase